MRGDLTLSATDSSIKKSIKNKNGNYENTGAGAATWCLMLVQCSSIIEDLNKMYMKLLGKK